jgi:micrococcal nuclease
MATDPEQLTTDRTFMSMKHLIALTFVCLFSFLIHQACSADTGNQVKWVIDGDTVVLNDGRKVRYIGINAPEIAHTDHKAEPFGDAAKQFNASLVYRKKIHLEFDKEHTDRYKRLLAYVFLEDGTFVNAKMLSGGYAYLLPHRPNKKHNAILLQSQREAMSARRGIWQKWSESKKTYVGNKRSFRFHLPTCSSAKQIKPRNRIIFKKKWAAYWEGYAPAKRCMPVFEIPQE